MDTCRAAKSIRRFRPGLVPYGQPGRAKGHPYRMLCRCLPLRPFPWPQRTAASHRGYIGSSTRSGFTPRHEGTFASEANKALVLPHGPAEKRIAPARDLGTESFAAAPWLGSRSRDRGGPPAVQEGRNCAPVLISPAWFEAEGSTLLKDAAARDRRAAAAERVVSSGVCVSEGPATPPLQRRSQPLLRPFPQHLGVVRARLRYGCPRQLQTGRPPACDAVKAPLIDLPLAYHPCSGRGSWPGLASIASG